MFNLCKLKPPSSWKHTFLLLYFPLYHFAQTIDHYGIYYSPVKYPRFQQYLAEGFHLFQFQALYPSTAPPRYPLTISKNPVHLMFQRYFSLFYLIRACSIAFIPAAMNTSRRLRIAIGEEFVYGESFHFETTFALWYSIFYLYLRFTLTCNTLDYKFCALFRMSKQNCRNFNLSQINFF